MKKEDMYKFIYWTVMPFAIGAILFFYIDKMEISIIDKLLIFIAIVVPVAAIRAWIGMKIFKESPTLAERMMSCNLRRKYGNGYCAMCPDGYTCASDIEKNDTKRKIKT